MIATRSPGRRGNERKRSAILDAARRLFLANGYVATRVEDIAAEAKVSKVTVFAHFGEKPSILEAVIARESAAMEAASLGSFNGHSDVSSALVAFGTSLLRLLANPEIRAFERLLTAPEASDPMLTRRFFDAGPRRSRDALARIIAEGAESGQLIDCDPVEAAEDLIGLWMGGLWRDEIAHQVSGTPEPAEIERRSKAGLTKFMQIYGARK